MEKLLHILQHSLGLDQYGQGNQYRNHFATGPGGSDFDDCNTLCDMGLMQDFGTRSFTGNMHCFVVTPAGIDYVALNSPKPPKLSRSKQRYLHYLIVADCYEDFHHYLKCKEAERKGFA
jgi:hypothetical protein